jgi:glycerophosphoryl diester phosphodiesterase
MMKTLVKLLATLSLVLSLLLVAPVSGPAYAACDVAPSAAHRGNWDDKRYPENTGNAFRYAQNRNSDTMAKALKYWETDLRFKADGTPVIHHDDANLSTLTFEQLLNDLQVDYNMVAMVEFKEDPATHWTVIKNLVAQYGVASRIIWTSFDADYLLEAQQQMSSVPRGLIQSVGDTTPQVIAAAHVQWFIKYSDSFTAARVANWLSGANSSIKLAAWSDKLDNNPAEYARMNGYTNMSAIIVNTPQAYSAYVTNTGCTLSKK